MSIESRCANPMCGKRYTVADSFAGKSVKCKVCGDTFTISRTEESVHEPAWGDEGKTVPKPALSAPTVPANATVGRFVVRAKVGAGASGTVYRAYDPNLDREVALKLPNPGVMTDPNRAERFLREARIAARLWHQHIVPVFDAGKDGEQFYIATAFVDGKPLSDDIPERGTDFARAARLARELAEALAFAHEQQIVHRDVKPQNVMLDKRDRVLLMDFGLAALQREEEARLTRDGAVLGTPAYMAPEQAKGQSADVTPAADQYAVGVVLYELLTGEVPFKGPIATVIHNVIRTEPEPPSARRPDVPADLEAICLKAMSKRPEDRYASCADLAAALRHWQERAAAALPATAVPGRDSKLPHPWAVVARLLCVLAVVGLAIYADASARKHAPPVVRGLTAKDYWSAGTKAKVRTSLDHSKAVSCAAFSPDGTRIATGGDDKIARVWDAKSGKELRAFEEHTGTILSAAFGPDGARVVTGSYDNTAKVWDANTGKEAFALKGHTGSVWSASFSPDGKRIVTASSDKTAKVWDAKTGTQLFPLTGHKDYVRRAAFSADGTRIVTASDDKAAKVWNAKTKDEIHVLEGHTAYVLSASFGPDGSRVVTSGNDKTAKVWDANTGKELFSLPVQGGGLRSAAFSSDGALLLTACDDKTARVWDANTGKELLVLEGHTAAVNSAAFSPDGKYILTASADKTAKVWESEPPAAPAK